MYDVIDISHWQGDVDFFAVKKSGIRGVIIKAGGSDGATNYYVDRRFKEYYKGAKEAGLLVGCYWFSGRQINSMVKGIRDAENFYNTIRNLEFELPVFMDYESGNKNNKAGNTDAIIGFCEYMEGRRYFVGIYGSDVNTFDEMVEKERLTPYYMWVAKYSNKAPHNVFHMWQFTSKGKVKGIKSNVDISHVYTDVSMCIVNQGFNGFGQPNS